MFKQCYNVMCGNNVETMLLWKASSHKLSNFFRFWFSWEHVATTPSALPGPFMHVIGDDGHISCIVRQISTKTHLKNSNSTLKKKKHKNFKESGDTKPSQAVKAYGCRVPSAFVSLVCRNTPHQLHCTLCFSCKNRRTNDANANLLTC